MVWYTHLFENFPQFIVIHTVKDSIVNESELYAYFSYVFTYSLFKHILMSLHLN